MRPPILVLTNAEQDLECRLDMALTALDRAFDDLLERGAIDQAARDRWQWFSFQHF